MQVKDLWINHSSSPRVWWRKSEKASKFAYLDLYIVYAVGTSAPLSEYGSINKSYVVANLNISMSKE